jgi:uncharacterized protein YdhG (YjbR/CyaY superfamily)
VKRKDTPKNFEEYLAGVHAPASGALKQMRAVIRSAVPAEAVEKISYGIPAFKHKRVLVWYGAFSKHCSLFPTASVIKAFKTEPKGFVRSKWTPTWDRRLRSFVRYLHDTRQTNLRDNPGGKEKAKSLGLPVFPLDTGRV